MKLCLGTVQFGMDYGVKRAGQPALSDSLKMIDIAVQNGIDTIDTATAYGTAEEVVGAYLSKHKEVRNNLNIVSKLAPDALDNKAEEHYAAVVYNALQKSLDTIGTDYLDGFLLHNSASVFDDAVIDALFRLKQSGLVKRVGASVYTPEEAKRAIGCGVDLLQVPYSVLDQRMDEHGVFALASSKKTIIHSRSAFTQGLMLMSETDIPLRLELARPIIKSLESYCRETGISRLQLAVAFVSRQASISHLVFGVDNPKQLLEIVEASRQIVDEEILETAQKEFDHLDERIIMPNKWGK